MDNKAMLQSCIASVKSAKEDIARLSQKTQNAKARDELTKATQSIDACINQCQAALNEM